MLKKIILYLFLILFTSSSFAQQVKFKQLTMEDGLSNNKVYTVIQDRNGFIWFGTSDGLNRYDGYSFKIYRNDSEDSNSIADNNIESLLEDSKGNIWIGTKAGILSKYDPSLENFTHWNLNAESSISNSIKTIYEDRKGNIWIGSYIDGLYRLNSSNFAIDHWKADPINTKSLSNNFILSIIEDNSGKILIGTYEGLNIFNPELPQKGFNNYFHEPDNPSSISDNHIWELSKSLIDSNIIWLGTDKDLTRYNSSKKTFEKIDISNRNNLVHGRGCGRIIEEIIAEEKIIWTDSYSGLLRINLSSGETKRFLHDKNNRLSLINNQINKLFRDRSGVLWITTQNGVSYITTKSQLFNSVNINYMDDDENSLLMNKNITAISKFDDNKIWIGTTDGLYLLADLNSHPRLRKLSKFDGSHIWSILSKNKDEIWIRSYGTGLRQVNSTKNSITNIDINTNSKILQSIYQSKALLEDSNKNIWVGYWGQGITKINYKDGTITKWLNEQGDSNSLSHNDVWTITEDRFGRIWIGTQGGGLNLFEDRDKGIFKSWLSDEKIKQKLNSNIYSLFTSSKNVDINDLVTILWIGTSEGLVRLEINNKDNTNIDVYDFDIRISNYSKKNGLKDNTVNSITEDDNGNLWLGTNSGISFFDIQKKSFANFTTEDGINGTMMNPESVLKLDSGLLLFGSSGGLNIFNPANIKLSSYKPKLVISDFKIFNNSVKIGNNSPLRKSVQTLEEISLSYNQNVFSFEFVALDYNSAKSIQYNYMMEGFDKDWSNSGGRRFVSYTNLNPGNYIFKVKATNADGIWNAGSKSISILIKPPFWQTWWFRSTAVFLFLFGIYFTVNKRISKLEQDRLSEEEFSQRLLESEERERERIAAGLHDSLGQNLLVIKNRALLGLKSDKVDFPKDQLSEISDSATLAIDEVRHIAYNLHPYQLSRLGLTKAIQSIISNIKETTKIVFKEDIDNIDSIFSGEKEIHIYRIAQELINNIVKHSEATNAIMKISKGNKRISVKIVDNGKGFDQHLISSNKKKSGGFGFQNINKRVNLLNGKLIINSVKGTEVNIIIPFENTKL